MNRSRVSNIEFNRYMLARRHVLGRNHHVLAVDLRLELVAFCKRAAFTTVPSPIARYPIDSRLSRHGRDHRPMSAPPGRRHEIRVRRKGKNSHGLLPLPKRRQRCCETYNQEYSLLDVFSSLDPASLLITQLADYSNGKRAQRRSRRVALRVVASATTKNDLLFPSYRACPDSFYRGVSPARCSQAHGWPANVLPHRLYVTISVHSKLAHRAPNLSMRDCALEEFPWALPASFARYVLFNRTPPS